MSATLDWKIVGGIGEYGAPAGPPLRVAMLAACPYPWPRGTPIRIHRMAMALASAGHEVHVVAYHLGEEVNGLPIHVHRIRDVPSYRHTAPGPTLRKLFQLDPMLSSLLRRLHRELAFDVVHAHHCEGVLAARVSGASAPIVYDAHTTLGGELPEYRLGLPKWLLQGLGRSLDRRIPALAGWTIAVSDSIRDTLVALGAVRPDRVVVIPNGVEPELFEGAPIRPSAPAPRVVFTGNLASYQGIELLLRAFAELRRSRPDARLAIVTHSSFAPYEALSRELGVREALEVEDVPFREQADLLAGAAVAVNPRVFCDGVPQKLLNYMASGAPTVSFAGSAVHLEHERTGLCVANGDTAAMAAAIERLIEDPALARRLGNAARETARREFSWTSVAGRVTEVYRSVLRAGRNRAASDARRLGAAAALPPAENVGRPLASP